MLAKDHTGKEYRSLLAMSKAWGINYSTLNTRLDAGWSLEKALTAPVKNQRIKCIDPKGREFKSMREMAKAWNIPPDAFFHRLYMGWNIAQALTIPFVKRKQGGHLNGTANVRNNSKY